MSLSFRSDIRSAKTFARNIKEAHVEQNNWKDALILHFAAEGHPAELIDLGIDNTGKLITGSLHAHEPDYLFKFLNKPYPPFPDEQKVDIKTAPSFLSKYKSYNFKASNLATDLADGTWYLIPRQENFYLLTNECLKFISQIEARHVSDRVFGGKPCHTVKSHHMDFYFNRGVMTEHVWNAKALDFISSKRLGQRGTMNQRD